MRLKENIEYLNASNEDACEILLNKLNEKYNDIEGIGNLIDTISHMHETDYLLEFLNVIEAIINSDEYINAGFPIKHSNNPFIKMAISQLKPRIARLLFPGRYLTPISSVEGTLSIVELNFYFYSKGHIKSVKDVRNLIFNGNIILPLTFFVEDFKEDLPFPDYSEEFFKHLSNINFDGKNLNDYIKCIKGHVSN